MSVTPTCKVSTAGLNAAMTELLRYPGRSEAEAVNISAYWIAVNTKNSTPFAALEDIDNDLGRFVVPKSFVNESGETVVSKRRKYLGGGKGVKVHRAESSGQTSSREVPLAALIIVARARADWAGNSKWKLDKNPFKGVSRMVGARAMTKAIVTMLKGRHSAAHFLQSGWVKAVRTLAQYAGKYGKPSGEGRYNRFDYSFSTRGDATVATEGGTNVFAQIINDTGGEGFSALETNEALLKYGSEPLQAAIDKERGLIVKRIEEVLKPRFEKFNRMAK